MIFDFAEEPRGLLYVEVLKGLLTECQSFGLVAQPVEKLSERGKAIISALHPHLIAKYQSFTWPGTTVIWGQPAAVFEYRFDGQSLHVLSSRSNRLFGWRRPHFPCDMFTRKENGDPYLVTISHHREAFILADCADALITDLLRSGTLSLRANEPMNLT